MLPPVSDPVTARTAATAAAAVGRASPRRIARRPPPPTVHDASRRGYEPDLVSRTPPAEVSRRSRRRRHRSASLRSENGERALLGNPIRSLHPRVTNLVPPAHEGRPGVGAGSAPDRVFARAVDVRYYHHPWLDRTGTTRQNHHLPWSAPSEDGPVVSLVFRPDRGDHLGGSGGSDRLRAARSGRAVGRSPVWPGEGAEHEGRPRDLDLDDFHDEDAAHGQWVDPNAGYVLTTKTRGGGFSLPMADCYRLGPYPNPRTRATRKARRWAASASSLRDWTQADRQRRVGMSRVHRSNFVGAPR